MPNNREEDRALSKAARTSLSRTVLDVGELQISCVDGYIELTGKVRVPPDQSLTAPDTMSICCAKYDSYIMSICCAKYESYIMSICCAKYDSYIMSICCAKYDSNIMSICCAEYDSYIMSICCAKYDSYIMSIC